MFILQHICDATHTFPHFTPLSPLVSSSAHVSFSMRQPPRAGLLRKMLIFQLTRMWKLLTRMMILQSLWTITQSLSQAGM